MELTTIVNTSPALAGIEITSKKGTCLDGLNPVTATPAAFAAGLAGAAAVAGAVAAGAAIGNAID
jgi:hypothetical protein